VLAGQQLALARADPAALGYQRAAHQISLPEALQAASR